MDWSPVIQGSDWRGFGRTQGLRKLIDIGLFDESVVEIGNRSGIEGALREAMDGLSRSWHVVRKGEQWGSHICGRGH